MVNTARVLVPGFKRVALVGDPPGRDTYRLNYGPDIAALAAEVELIDLTGMAVTEVRKRVAVLPNDAVVFYTSIFVDGAGVVHTRRVRCLPYQGRRAAQSSRMWKAISDTGPSVVFSSY